jgi:hypothetical protein
MQVRDAGAKEDLVIWLIFCLSALGPLFALPAFEAAAVSRYGSDAWLWVGMLFVPVVLLALVAIPFLAVLSAVRSTRRYSCPVLVASILLIAASWAGNHLGNGLRMNAFARLGERSRPLVEAIEAYAADRGEPPDKLQELVPKYLPAVPGTGMRACPEYEYRKKDDPEKWGYGSNPWVLTVQTPSGGINWDEFMYFPLRDYPEHGYGGSLERLGDWAYLHE